MARFFKNLEEDEDEIKTRIEETREERGEPLDKNKRKLEELTSKVRGVVESKCFEKTAKKFMGELKKYASVIKSNGIPECLSELFKDKRFGTNKQLQKELDAFNAQFVTGTDMHAVHQVAAPKKGTKNEKESHLASIMQLKSDSEREKLLKEIDVNEISNSDAFSVTIALVSAANKCRDSGAVISALTKYLKRDLIDKRLFNNVGVYLERVFSCLSSKDHDDYLHLIDLLIEKGWEDGAYKKLEFKFLKLGIVVDTEVEPFRLLSLVRTGKWEDAKKIMKECGEELERDNTGNTFEDEKCHTFVWSQLLKEYGEAAIKRQEFLEGFGALSRLLVKDQHTKVQLYALCVILNGLVANSPIFRDFLEDFKGFDANPLLLRSVDTLDEVFRAFYLLHNEDAKNACLILQECSGINLTPDALLIHLE